MTRLAAALFAALVSATATAQDPKPPVTPLEGTWREPVPPGQKVELWFSATFTGNQVTINLHGTALKGTFEINTLVDPAIITFTFTKSGEVYRGTYRVENDQLFLRINPYSGEGRTPTGSPMGLATVSRTLEKVKK
jgi:hypothetical protein